MVPLIFLLLHSHASNDIKFILPIRRFYRTGWYHNKLCCYPIEEKNTSFSYISAAQISHYHDEPNDAMWVHVCTTMNCLPRLALGTSSLQFPDNKTLIIYAHRRKNRTQHVLGLLSLSGKTFYHQIAWSREAARLDAILIVSLCNLTVISATLLSKCLPNFWPIGNV